jgi:hypothetical protein
MITEKRPLADASPPPKRPAFVSNVRNDVMIEIEKKDIMDNEPLLYIGSTPSTPPDIEFIFGYKRDGDFDWVNGEFSYQSLFSNFVGGIF